MVLNLERPEQYGMRASSTYFCPEPFCQSDRAGPSVCPRLAVSCLGVGLPLRLLSGYSLLLLMPVLYLTQSRSGWLGAAAGLGLAGMLMALRRSVKRFLAMLILCPLLLAALGAGLWAVSPDGARARQGRGDP